MAALSGVAHQDDDALPGFEAMATARSKKSSRSASRRNAAAEPPTKLGVKAGGAITVETAILSLVTKSANDAATALGEFLGGRRSRSPA